MVHAFAGALLRKVIVMRLTELMLAGKVQKAIIPSPRNNDPRTSTVSMLGARLGQCLDFLFVLFFFSVSSHVLFASSEVANFQRLSSVFVEVAVLSFLYAS